jgi:hypothetical protein
MNSNWYQVEYMSQNALSYTFFYKRIFEDIRKVYLSLLVVEIKFWCKERKVQEDKYEHYHQQILKNCSAILTNLSIFTKITKKSEKILQFWEAKIAKVDSLYYIHKKERWFAC